MADNGDNNSNAGSAAPAARRRKNHRGGKKKRARRKSFAVPNDEMRRGEEMLEDRDRSSARPDFYSRQNLSSASINSEALLDHREQQPFMRPRRPSLAPTGSSGLGHHASHPHYANSPTRLRTVQGGGSGGEDDDEGAPLLPPSARIRRQTESPFESYGAVDFRHRSQSQSSARRNQGLPLTASSGGSYNVNYPPSVPGSPRLRATDPLDMSFGDVMLRDDLDIPNGSPRMAHVDGDEEAQDDNDMMAPGPLNRRHNMGFSAPEDVCFPQEGLSEMGEDEMQMRDAFVHRLRSRRSRGKWPDLDILDEWSRIEKEGRNEERRTKRITEPQLINGRLRSTHRGWYRTEEDAPYRFTYFNEDFEDTIHSQTISELVQPGSSFKELFIPDPPVLSDSEEDVGGEEFGEGFHHGRMRATSQNESLTPTRQGSISTTKTATKRDDSATPNLGLERERTRGSANESGTATPSMHKSPSRVKSPTNENSGERTPKYGERPVWWLDVLSPSEAEMKVISKAFGIHPLTSEDIMLQEAREKVELFRNYYFVNYRSFEQDHDSEDFLEPVNMYVVVFREGVISFHFSQTPHPANVRRRVRQLQDYMIISSDWISYAIIDDITDVFVPLIQNIEDEVDDIDDGILELHSPNPGDKKKESKKENEKGEESGSRADSDMLRRVGDCRKRVMGLYRLLGNKADVIKGFAKRCNEHWDVAPRSEIGLYLGDIQDHIVTMTANLSHYEKILARSHGNYLAQINIRMNERSEQTADGLNKLTVLGTIVLPMNIITGLWGMNVWVPGQEYEGDLKWFWCITAGLFVFGFACYALARRVYKII